MNPFPILICLSLVANVALGWLWLDGRDDLAGARKDYEHAQGAANECSKGVDDLQLKAADNAKKAAAASAAKGDARADAILSTPASNADDCKAAAERATSWLKGRK